MPTTLTYTADQITAAYKVHDTCHELTGVLADEPPTIAGTEWMAWHDSYCTAWRLHEDAEANYRHEFPNAATRPEAHEVIAAATATRVEVLRAHVIETVTQMPIAGEDFNSVVIDCLCGVAVRGVMPGHLDSTSGSLMWLMAEHIARELPA